MNKSLTAGVSVVAGLIILSGAGLAAGASDGQPAAVTPSTEVVVDDLTVSSQPIEAVTSQPAIEEPGTTVVPAPTEPPVTVSPTSTEPAPAPTTPPTLPAPEPTPPVISVPRPVPCAECAPCGTSAPVPTGFRAPRPQSNLSEDKANTVTLTFVVTTNDKKVPSLDKKKSVNLDWVSEDKITLTARGDCYTLEFGYSGLDGCTNVKVTGPDGATIKAVTAREKITENGKTFYFSRFEIRPLSADKEYTITMDCKKKP